VNVGSLSWGFARLVAVAAGVGVCLSVHGEAGLAMQVPDPCGPSGNPVSCENARPGSPRSEWDVDGLGDPTIRGFSTDISVNRGERVDFKINTSAGAYEVEVFRLGYYGGAGARRVASVAPTIQLPHAQPDCMRDPSTGLHDCGNWVVSASWHVPPDAASGLYLARPRRADTGGATHIPFIVRADDRRSDILFQTSDTTWVAYNAYGGNSLYQGAPAGRAYKVSYNRPFVNRATVPPQNSLFWGEYPMIRWLERQGYDVSYFSGVDSDRRGERIRDHRVFLSVGHDEYWSSRQRAAVEAARDAGVHLAFFSGNEVFWKIRWEPSIDGSDTSHRTLVCYKETYADAKLDPSPEWTGTWRDPRFSPPSDAGRPENALLGTMFTVLRGAGGSYGSALRVPAEFRGLRFWRGTAVAMLQPGETAVLSDHTLGYEWGEPVENTVRPSGLIRMSSTTESVPAKIVDHGSQYAEGTATHALTMYRAPSGSLVFSASTIQWAFGLDAWHDGPSTQPDIRMMQATVNLLADMGAQPWTLDSGLSRASASSDVLPPMATIDRVSDRQFVTRGVETITGKASDFGGGVVAGVEVSTDGGGSWRSARGASDWSFQWVPMVGGLHNVLVRAVDDSGNLQREPATATVMVQQRGCPCSFWDHSARPAEVDVGLGTPIELGLRFAATVDGVVAGIRFFLSPGASGPLSASLWRADGVRLATVRHDPASSGWQLAPLAEPVSVRAGSIYVVSYHAPRGGFALDRRYFVSPLVQGPLTASAPGNGVFRLGAAGVFPDTTYDGSNFWVDVVFETRGVDGAVAPQASGSQFPDTGPSEADSPPDWARQPSSAPSAVVVAALAVVLLGAAVVLHRALRRAR
jgi:hypothetical protein